MLNKIHIENFRKHTDLTVEFTPGINCIRAANEQGKSSLLESISYALFGAKGLKEAIDDVVTYGLPASKLKVDLTFTIAGIIYSVRRGKSGAELTAPGVTVTGQTEVTKFVEGLLGASQDMASKLMLAKQKDLGGALSGGATKAGEMIEDLANLELLPELVSLIGEHLPSGNTAAAEALVESLRTQAAPGELPKLEPLQLDVTNARQISGSAVLSHKKLKAELDEQPVDLARQILADEKALQATIASAEVRKGQLDRTLSVEPPVAPAQTEIDACRAQVEQEKQLATATKLHTELKAAGAEVLWDKDWASLVVEMDGAAAKLQGLLDERSDLTEKKQALTDQTSRSKSEYTLARAKVEAKLIKETTCALCQKDLKDVPEVALINSPLSAQLQQMDHIYQVASDAAAIEMAALVSKIEVNRVAVAAARGYDEALKEVVRRNQALATLYARAEAYITLDTSTVPALWTWTGPTGRLVGTAAKLAELETAAATAVAAQATRAEQRNQLGAVDAELATAHEKLAELQVTDAKETLEIAADLTGKVQAALESAQIAERALSAAQQAFELARAEHTRAAETQEKAKANIAKAEATLAEMQANNALIKKLRDARPKITDRLWAIVLAAVTTYCSDVRGERSVITRADGKFKINGFPASGLSGSAEDVLGLAIRFALAKTFLSNVSFVILDEVAAACDDQRETAMLGLLATSGFQQTILVTHSQLCESFADNIITL